MESKIERNLRELGYTPAKSKKQQRETPEQAQGRDLFQTPNYAVDLLVPFIPPSTKVIWECAAGEGKIVQRLTERGYSVYPSDIRAKWNIHWYNFLTGDETEALPYPLWVEFQNNRVAIVTNPPFSLKKKFYKKCLEFGVPFALLIPADYSGWLIKACAEEGAEKIIPARRVDYITPTGKSGATGHGAAFHSLWLTWGFNLGRTETYVELSLKEKKENI